MKKDRLYMLTFFSVTLIYLMVSVVAVSFFVRSAALELIGTQLRIGKKEAKTFSSLVGHNLSNGIPKNSLIDQIQETILNTNQENVFLSVIDWSGKIVAYPEIKNVGSIVNNKNSFVSSVADNLTTADFYALYREKDASDSEVILMYPIENSDWVVVSHMNVKLLDEQLTSIKFRYYTIFLIIGLIIIPTFVITTRYIGSLYERKLELQKQNLEDQVLNLSKLNDAVIDYKVKVGKNTNQNRTKKRLLTQLSNELLPVPIENIAHIYTENTITYVTSFDGKRSTANSSLDELFSQLDTTRFFRANRQCIIAISSIDKIVKYGNNQLKILVNPTTDADILIGKNKAAEFKNWLNL
ncbi:LytR/AlgR family response regulator transcription factor [Maribacter sp. CXY002]|uniref:LytR/AlgR family response regulator transcription factor n=1 Tax=Maribacter luteocoastalis TaxID=3407671 RepID=UPI003B6830BC